MKTAVSIPDKVFREAERAAKRLGLSRSELYARALEAFLEPRDAVAIKESYDRAFGGPDTDGLTFQRDAAGRSLLDVEW